MGACFHGNFFAIFLMVLVMGKNTRVKVILFGDTTKLMRGFVVSLGENSYLCRRNYKPTNNEKEKRLREALDEGV